MDEASKLARSVHPGGIAPAVVVRRGGAGDPGADESGPRGVVYLVGGGRAYIGELRRSLASLRRVAPGLPVTIFSALPLPPRVSRMPGCRVVRVDVARHPLKLKVEAIRRSPYRDTLFLDTDTRVLGPIEPLFNHLAEGDLCVGHEPRVDWERRPPRFLDFVEPGEFNTGVILVRKTEATRRFLDRWQEAVDAEDPEGMWPGHRCDQHHFNRLRRHGVLAACGVRFALLDNRRYNVRGNMVAPLKAAAQWHDARILHHRTLGMKLRKAAESLIDPELARELVRKLRWKTAR